VAEATIETAKIVAGEDPFGALLLQAVAQGGADAG